MATLDLLAGLEDEEQEEDLLAGLEDEAPAPTPRQPFSFGGSGFPSAPPKPKREQLERESAALFPMRTAQEQAPQKPTGMGMGDVQYAQSRGGLQKRVGAPDKAREGKIPSELLAAGIDVGTLGVRALGAGAAKAGYTGATGGETDFLKALGDIETGIAKPARDAFAEAFTERMSAAKDDEKPYIQRAFNALLGEFAATGFLAASALEDPLVVGALGKAGAKTLAKTLSKPAQAVGEATGKVLERVSKSQFEKLIKPLKRHWDQGFDLKVAQRRGVIGDPAFTAAEALRQIREDGAKLRAIIKQGEDEGARLNLNSYVDDLEDDFAKNPGDWRDLDNPEGVFKYFRDRIKRESQDGVMDLGQAQDFKQWVGEKSDFPEVMQRRGVTATKEDTDISIAAERFYQKIKNGIEDAGPPGIRDVNKRISEMLPIYQAAKYRLPVWSRHDALGLKESIGVGATLATGNAAPLAIVAFERLTRRGWGLEKISALANKLRRATPEGKERLIGTLRKQGLDEEDVKASLEIADLSPEEMAKMEVRTREAPEMAPELTDLEPVPEPVLQQATEAPSLTQTPVVTQGRRQTLAQELGLPEEHPALTRLETAEKEAREDVLSALPNRRAWTEDSKKPELQGHASSDVVRFKRINDEFGHDAGDEVISAIGAEAKTIAEETGVKFYRLGGDEFVTLAETEEKARDAMEILHQRLKTRKIEAYDIETNKPVAILDGIDLDYGHATGAGKPGYLKADADLKRKRAIKRPRSVGETERRTASRERRAGGEPGYQPRRVAGQPESEVPGPQAEVPPRSGVDPDEILYQEESAPEKAPVFFSPLRKAIRQKMPNAAPPDQIRGLLKGAGIKEDELKWTDVEGFLEGKTKVTKEEFLRHLDQNEVKVEEVVKGEPKLSLQQNWPETEYAQSDVYDVVDRTGRVRYTGGRADAQAYIEEGSASSADTKFSSYQTPGGENYRELLLKFGEPEGRAAQRKAAFKEMQTAMRGEYGESEILEKQKKHQALLPKAEFRSSHFDEPNILAHVRFNERKTPDGQKVLFIEEVQSDWHQKGRKEGYKDLKTEKRRDEIGRELEEIFRSKEFKDRTSNDVMRRVAALQDERDGLDFGNVPDAPFKKTWHELALRRMLRWAAENDFDRVAWTTGEQQAARYDLSKQINALRVRRDGENAFTIVAELPNNKVHEIGQVSAKELPEHVGKDLAEKIINQKEDFHKYSGLDLKVGGEGMKAFYDKMIPQYLDKYGKRWGAKVEPLDIGAIPDEKALSEAERSGDSRRIADALGKPETVQSLPVTPEMKRSVLEEGQPLFQRPKSGPKGSFEMKGDKAVITLFKGKADVTTVMHELAHKWRQKALESLPDDAAARSLRWTGQKEWNRQAEEKFARTFERYLYEGRAPRKDLEKPMEHMRNRFRTIYRNLPEELKDEIPEEMRIVYDNLLVRNRRANQERVGNILRLMKKAQPVVAARLLAKLRSEFSENEKDS